tara:strand:- start:360 stop:842 length:483 start_codon:yes stop_codon:yes gene_type:complete
LCTIPFATSLLATFKSKFASPAEEPSNFTFPTDAALTVNFGVALAVVVVAEEVAILLFEDWPLNDAHKLCACVVDAVKDILRARVSTSIGVSVQKVTTKSVRSLCCFLSFFCPFLFWMNDDEKVVPLRFGCRGVSQTTKKNKIIFEHPTTHHRPFFTSSI